MRITERQLRRIVRQEILSEADKSGQGGGVDLSSGTARSLATKLGKVAGLDPAAVGYVAKGLDDPNSLDANENKALAKLLISIIENENTAMITAIKNARAQVAKEKESPKT